MGEDPPKRPSRASRAIKAAAKALRPVRPTNTSTANEWQVVSDPSAIQQVMSADLLNGATPSKAGDMAEQELTRSINADQVIGQVLLGLAGVDNASPSHLADAVHVPSVSSAVASCSSHGSYRRLPVWVAVPRCNVFADLDENFFENSAVEKRTVEEKAAAEKKQKEERDAPVKEWLAELPAFEHDFLPAEEGDAEEEELSETETEKFLRS
ncbi:hypothetical protein G7046_g3944 [Stylonectria norvegica]|nr:hypothetical protein G7046_g3944 [Stylonectria norvegica]